MTRTITYLNTYSSLQWVRENDLGYEPDDSLFASDLTQEMMAELREDAVQARYVVFGTGEHAYEDLPTFTTHEAMFALMQELPQRALKESVEKATNNAAEAMEVVLAALELFRTLHLGDAAALSALNKGTRMVNLAADGLKSAFHHRARVQYRVAFPAWRIIDLSQRSEENHRAILAAVESCTGLTASEKAEWEEEFDFLYGGIAPSETNLRINCDRNEGN
jgi:hypothetical protein